MVLSFLGVFLLLDVVLIPLLVLRMLVDIVRSSTPEVGTLQEIQTNSWHDIHHLNIMKKNSMEYSYQQIRYNGI